MKRKEYPQHPSFIRAKEFAIAHESEATTYRGLLRFTLNHARFVRKHGVRTLKGLALLSEGAIGKQPTWTKPIIMGHGRDKITAAMKARKADPDARRARDDKHFRKNYLARLRKQEKEIMRVDTIEAVTARAETGLARMNEIRRLRSLATGKPLEMLAKLPPSGAPKLSFSADDARKVKASINMRGSDARCYATRKLSYGHHVEASTDWSNRNKPRGIRAVHDNYVRAFAVISPDKRTIDFVLHNTTGRLTLPEGYVWGDDVNLLRASVADRLHVDYHPAWRELRLVDAARYLVAAIESNRQKREEMKALETAERAQIEGVFVCLADSSRAGNCVAGSIAFAERHHIDPKRHYPALQLLAMANGDASRVRLAITAARLRHEREMQQGFAVLAEHQVA